MVVTIGGNVTASRGLTGPVSGRAVTYASAPIAHVGARVTVGNSDGPWRRSSNVRSISAEHTGTQRNAIVVGSHETRTNPGDSMRSHTTRDTTFA